MDKARKERRIYLYVFAVSAAVAFVTLIVALVCLLKYHYVAMAIFAVVSAAALYVFVFYLFKYIDHSSLIKLIPIVKERGIENISEIAEAFGWKVESLEGFLKKYKGKGYID